MLLYPKATWKPVAAHSGPMTTHLGLILHVQVGYHSPFTQFSNERDRASSTWWAAKGGGIEQYVDANLIAWAQAAGNPQYNSVETEGYPNEPLTDIQVHQLGELYAWGHQVKGWPLILAEQPGHPGLGWHGMGGAAWGGHVNCPGDIRKAQRVDILRVASALLAPSSTDNEDDDMPKWADEIEWSDGTKTQFYANGDIKGFGDGTFHGTIHDVKPDLRKNFDAVNNPIVCGRAKNGTRNKADGYIAGCANGDEYAFPLSPDQTV